MNNYSQSQLREKFTSFILPGNRETITQAELLNYLDQLSNGKQFDREVAEQLFEKVPQDYSGTIKLSKFKEVYLEAEAILIQKIQVINQQLANYENQREMAINKQRLVQKEEVLNSYGIMDNSTVLIQIREGQLLPELMDEKIYAQVVCGNQEGKTNQTKNTITPQWNNEYIFPIYNGSEDLIIFIKNFKTNEIYGQITISLKTLNDQQKHEE